MPSFDLDHSIQLATQNPNSGRGALLRSAEQLFAERGYEATTVRDIADAAGVSVPTLHLHWKHKATLYEAVCKLQARHFFEFLEAEGASLARPDALLESVERTIDFLTAHPTLAPLALQGIVGREASKGLSFTRPDEAALRRLEAVVEKMLPSTDRPDASLTVLCFFYFLVLCFTDGPLQRTLLGGSVYASGSLRERLKRFSRDLAGRLLDVRAS